MVEAYLLVPMSGIAAALFWGAALDNWRQNRKLAALATASWAAAATFAMILYLRLFY